MQTGFAYKEPFLVDNMFKYFKQSGQLLEQVL